MINEPTDVELHLFARNGHLGMLSLDRFEVGELSSTACRVIIDHLRDCQQCSDRFEHITGDTDTVHPRVIAQPWSRTAAVAGTLAAAAALIVWAIPKPQQVNFQPSEPTLSAGSYTTTASHDGYRETGAGLRLWSHNAGPNLELAHGDAIAWDTAVTVQFAANRGGYGTLIVATSTPDFESADSTGGFTDDDRIQLLVPMRALDRMGTTLQLPGAHTPPGIAGKQRFVAIVCPDVFDADLDTGHLDAELSNLNEDCAVSELTIRRQ